MSFDGSWPRQEKPSQSLPPFTTDTTKMKAHVSALGQSGDIKTGSLTTIAQKRQKLSVEASIIKIEANSPLIPRKQEEQSDETQEFLHLNLSPGTTVLDVFLGQQSEKSAL